MLFESLIKQNDNSSKNLDIVILECTVHVIVLTTPPETFV